MFALKVATRGTQHVSLRCKICKLVFQRYLRSFCYFRFTPDYTTLLIIQPIWIIFIIIKYKVCNPQKKIIQTSFSQIVLLYNFFHIRSLICSCFISRIVLVLAFTLCSLVYWYILTLLYVLRLFYFCSPTGCII